MADSMKKARLVPRGGGVVLVISGWPLAAMIAGGIGYCAFRHYQKEHKSGDTSSAKNGLSFFRKTEEPTTKESKELKESVQQKHDEIKAAVDESFKKSKQNAEEVKMAANQKIDDLKAAAKDKANK